MATSLTSPGVQVSVIDESFYLPAAPGTVPLLAIVSAQDKSNASATGTAQGTTKANAGKVWTITSQRDLTDTFGVPKFYTDDNGNPRHGDELNEYGLQAAYSLLGISSRVYVVRADINTSELVGSSSIPTGKPVSGTYWFDTDNTVYGINEWDADNAVFVSKTPSIIDDSTVDMNATNLVPNSSFGSIGNYAVVATSDNQAPVYYKNKSNQWVLVGSNEESLFGNAISSSTFISHCWATSHPVVTSSGFSGVTTGSIFSINGTAVTIGSDLTVAGVASTINGLLPQAGVGAKVSSSGKLELYSDVTGANDGAIALTGTALTSLGLTTGTYAGLAISIAPHTQVPQFGTTGAPNGSVYVKTTSPGKGANWSLKYYNGATQTFSTVSAPLYATAEAAIKGLDSTGGTGIGVGTLFVESNYDHGTGTEGSPTQANFKIWRRSAVSPTTVVGSIDVTSISNTVPAHTGTIELKLIISESVPNSSAMQNTATVVFATLAPNTATSVVVGDGDQAVASISAAGFTYIDAFLDDNGKLTLQHRLGGEIHIVDSEYASITEALGLTPYDVVTKTGTVNMYSAGDYDQHDYRISNWKPLVFEAKTSQPTTDPADGTLWYDTNLEQVDILYHNGTTWVGYKDATAFPTSDPSGPLISSTQPTTQSDGTPLVTGDIWIDLASTEDYGQSIYVWNGSTLKWVKQDPTDQESPNGWVFDDARWATSGQATEPSTIKDLLASNYIDPDAPNPVEYPQGTRLWNLRRSGFNIKKYVANFIDINANDGQNIRYQNDPMDGSNLTVEYNPNRWVSISPNNDNGSGTFGRKAQRAFVVSALKSLIDTNRSIRDTDTLVFNLIASPGYPELIANMIAFNNDRGNTAFVVGDTPFRLRPTSTILSNWANNTAGATDNGDIGAVSYDEHMAMFYPSGYTTDNLGNKVVVPPSHMMLRTIALNDQIAYPWFAPAGTRRGAVDNATSVGYLENGEFKTTALPQDLRDTLYLGKVNPIATLNGIGVVNFGNLTRAKNATAQDRINVSRLVAYIRRQLDLLSRPFLFEPNDTNTRNELRSAAEGLMQELVALRALYDYIVVCDTSNNTTTRVDRNELWMDIAIEPVKTVEFIYIPLRLKATGSIKAGLF